MSFNDFETFRSCYGFTLRYIVVFDGALTLVNFSTIGGLLPITSTKTFCTFFAPLTVIRLSEAQNSIRYCRRCRFCPSQEDTWYRDCGVVFKDIDPGPYSRSVTCSHDAVQSTQTCLISMLLLHTIQPTVSKRHSPDSREQAPPGTRNLLGNFLPSVAKSHTACRWSVRLTDHAIWLQFKWDFNHNKITPPLNEITAQFANTNSMYTQNNINFISTVGVITISKIVTQNL